MWTLWMPAVTPKVMEATEGYEEVWSWYDLAIHQARPILVFCDRLSLARFT